MRLKAIQIVDKDRIPGGQQQKQSGSRGRSKIDHPWKRFLSRATGTWFRSGKRRIGKGSVMKGFPYREGCS